MKIAGLLLCMLPLFVLAQKQVPRLENDTLYTKSGFKIYTGQTLHFAKGTGKDGKFRFIKIKNEIPETKLTDNLIVVKKMKNFGISVLGNAYIEIIGSIVFKDGSRGSVDLHMAFDNAINGYEGFKNEVIVPEEFRQ
jgi:hypothetical protein